MSSYEFNYSFNITGNVNAVMNDISSKMDVLNKKIDTSTSLWSKWQGKLLTINQFTQALQGVDSGLQSLLNPGKALNSQLAELSAIAGITGSGLREIERYARATAKEFGGNAAQSVESYKLLLSQLSPELAKHPAALQEMGRNVAILSKQMGGDSTSAAQVLTTAMNQYGISLDNPTEASRVMADMMNVMAEAARQGSAELPQIKEALSQAGMMAKAAGVSFEETNAAIQVLDKAGKKGAEGGVALRNVMATLAKGRFLPKRVLDELQTAGINIGVLTDKGKSLEDRLRVLQPVMQDSALFSKLFGLENAAAAMALVNGIDQMGEWTTAITGTNTAVGQAATIMDTYAERQSRVQARFDDLKISIFNATGNFGIWSGLVMQSLLPVSMLMPLLMGVGKALLWIKGGGFVTLWSGLVARWRLANIQLIRMNANFNIAKIRAIGFSGGVMLATTSLIKFATTGLWSGIKALGTYILSLITGGATSVAFAATATASFATFKIAAVTACRAVGVAIMNIPIIGWIAAIIAGIIWLVKKIKQQVQKLWDNSEGFRRVVMGVANVIKMIGGWIGDFFSWIWGGIKKVGKWFGDIFKGIGQAFNYVWQPIKNFFTWIWNKISSMFGWIKKKIIDPIVGVFDGVWTAVKKFFTSIWNWINKYIIKPIKDAWNWLTGKVSDAYNEGADMGSESFARDQAAKEAEGTADPEIVIPGVDGSSTNDPLVNGLNGVGGTADSSPKIRNINITIDKLVEGLTIQTTNLKEGAEEVKKIVIEALLGAVNDGNYALQ